MNSQLSSIRALFSFMTALLPQTQSLPKGPASLINGDFQHMNSFEAEH